MNNYLKVQLMVMDHVIWLELWFLSQVSNTDQSEFILISSRSTKNCNGLTFPRVLKPSKLFLYGYSGAKILDLERQILDSFFLLSLWEKNRIRHKVNFMVFSEDLIAREKLKEGKISIVLEMMSLDLYFTFMFVSPVDFELNLNFYRTWKCRDSFKKHP